MTLRFESSSYGPLRRWMPPQHDRQYVMGVDVAEGKMRDQFIATRQIAAQLRDSRDFSSAHVLDIDTNLIVAAYHGQPDTHQFAIAVYNLGLHYNSATIAVELNGPGVAINDALVNWGYPNLYVKPLAPHQQRPRQDLSTPQIRREIGWRTNTETRPKLINTIHSYLADQLPTKDAELLDEMRTMEFDKTGKPRGVGVNKDDRVFSFGVALCVREFLLESGEVSEEASRYKSMSPDDRGVWEHVHALVGEREQNQITEDFDAWD